jgi:hypothetical protein
MGPAPRSLKAGIAAFPSRCEAARIGRPRDVSGVYEMTLANGPAALGGFAVVAHWLPYLAFSVLVGSLDERFDSRRIIQAGAVLFVAEASF